MMDPKSLARQFEFLLHDLTRNLIAIPTDNPSGEKKLAQFLKEYLKKYRIPSEILPSENGGASLIAHYGKAKESLLLNSPIDTVPAGDLSKWKYYPFNPTIHNGKLYGRGAADAKSGIACMIITLIILSQQKLDKSLRIDFLVDSDEQSGKFSGLNNFFKHNKTNIKSAIIGYAVDDFAITLGARGYYRYSFSTDGSAVHTGSRYKKGVNAISKMAKFIYALDAQPFPSAKESIFDFGSNLTVSLINGGAAINMVPDNCEIKIDIRTTPSQDRRFVERYFREISEIVTKVDKDFKIRGFFIEGNDGYEIDKSEEIINSLYTAIEYATGKVPGFKASGGQSHSGAILHQKGIKATIWGPKGESVHSYDEYVELDSLTQTVEIYLRTIFDYFKIK